MKESLRFPLLALLRWLFPAISFNQRPYPLLEMVVWGLRQRLSKNRHIPWPVHPTTQIIDHKKIKLGNLAPGISMGCFIDARNGIEFGENVWIGPKVSIISMDHDLCDYDKYLVDKPIMIGKDSLLTNGCTILPGVLLGEHTIVAAGAVVTKSFPDGNQLLAGVPAKMIKKLDAYTGKTFPER
jgi:acetyltransferase-like isoleucine patch superfamily enzyme